MSDTHQRTLEQRIESLENNVADHEKWIGKVTDTVLRDLALRIGEQDAIITDAKYRRSLVLELLEELEGGS